MGYGALPDHGALYFALGNEKIQSLSPTLINNWKEDLEVIPKHLARFSPWQYGSGQHSSGKKEKLGSAVLSVLSNASISILNHHTALEGSSP